MPSTFEEAKQIAETSRKPLRRKTKPSMPFREATGMPVLADPRHFHRAFDDFHGIDASAVDADSRRWHIQVDGAVGGTVVPASYNGGAVQLTSGVTANEGTTIQFYGSTSAVTTVGGQFSIVKDSKIPAWFETRIALDAAALTNMCLAIGLAPVGTVEVFADTTGAATIDDFIGFVAENTNVLSFASRKNDNQTNHASSVATLAAIATALTPLDSEFVALGFYFDGGERVVIYNGSTKVGAFQLGANTPDDVLLVPTFSIKTLNTTAKALAIDYVDAVGAKRAAA